MILPLAQISVEIIESLIIGDTGRKGATQSPFSFYTLPVVTPWQ